MDSLKMDKLFPIFCLSFMIVTASALKINSIDVPNEVSLDDNDSVILDCDFDASNASSDLVVKWFLDDKLIYQWISNHEPQEVGAFKGKLDLTYRATPNKSTQFRALKIKQVSLDMAGMYKCVVFTFLEEDFMNKSMVVMSTPNTLKIEQVDFGEEDSVSVVCSAYGIYPAPVLNITNSEGDEFAQADNHTLKNYDGSYNITQIITYKKEFSSDVTFTCALTIPDTSFRIEKSLEYISGSVSAQYEIEIDEYNSTTEIILAKDSGSVPVILPWMTLLLAVSTMFLSA